MKTNLPRWIASLMTAAALAASASLCQAQAPVTYTFDSDAQTWHSLGGGGTYTWDATNGVGGGGCLAVTFGSVSEFEIDPGVDFSSTVDTTKYLKVTVDVRVEAGSGTTGPGGSGGYGNLQAVFRDASWSWNSIWYGAIYPPAANNYVTYSFVIGPPYAAGAHLQFQLQGNSGTGYSGPVTVYIDNVTVAPVPNPWLMEPFVNGSLIGGGFDSSVNGPFVDPVAPSAPTNITPAGSWKIDISNPVGYSGWNQYQPPSAIDTTRFQNIGFDVYYDGPTGGTLHGGTQLILFKNGWSGTVQLGAVAFNASMIGQWTHFNFPVASHGVTASPALVFQGGPGADNGTNAITFHVDNVVFWNPVTRPSIISLTPNHDPGGLKIAVDGNGTSNQYDQEGIASPATNNNANHFWVNQTPATYSFTLTNFPAPAVAPGFDAHIYLVNGDSITANGNVGSWGYNQTYSGVPYNAVDYAGLRIQNRTNDVVAIFEWKTNTPSANAPGTNIISVVVPGLTSANGTWTLNFSDNTSGSIVAPNGSVVTNFTLPDFITDPNYSGNFTPATSLVQFGVFKHDVNNTGVNNNQSAIFTHVLVTNMNGTVFDDNFSSPGLKATYDWQVAQYYQFSANRTTWLPAGTAYWLKWNTTQSGFAVQSASDVAGPWGNAGVTYTYSDGTGTNTIGAIPAASLPPGNTDFFRLAK